MLSDSGKTLNLSRLQICRRSQKGSVSNNIDAADKGGFAVCWLERNPVRRPRFNGGNALQGLSVWNSGLSSVNETAFMINF